MQLRSDPHLSYKSQIRFLICIRSVWEDHECARIRMHVGPTVDQRDRISSLAGVLYSSPDSPCGILVHRVHNAWPDTCYDIFRDGRGTLPILGAFGISDLGKLTHPSRRRISPFSPFSLSLFSPRASNSRSSFDRRGRGNCTSG